MTRVLYISSDAVGEEMAGPGIRAYELTRALQPHAEVTLAAIESPHPPPPDVRVEHYHQVDQRALRPLIAEADTIVCQPQWAVTASWLRRSGARLVFDVYDPEPFETLEFLRHRGPLLRSTLHTLTVDRYLAAFHDAHHLMCASGKQRDLWIGALLAERLIGRELYDRDPTLLSVIDAVPFGVPSSPPVAGDHPGIRARFPQIAPDDEIVLWNGGLWNWLDGPTAVRAIDLVARRRPGVRLVFMGAASAGPAKAATEATRRVAAELGRLDQHVFFNTEWVPYAERGAWLLEADCSLSTHVEHLETRFAFRTRLLDCFWAGLPIVCTRGDELAERIERDDLGTTAPQRDPEALAAALEQVLTRGRAAYAPQLAATADAFRWSRVAAPLVRWATAVDLPPRLGSGPRGRLAWRAGHRLRSGGYRAARSTLNALGIRDWPRL
jgi:glycosyltransferase involved in cell wall biosynthesis